MSIKQAIPENISGFVSDATLLIQKEIKLAKVEAEEKLDQAQTGLIAIGASMVLALASLFVLVQALVEALGNLMPPSVAALLVGIVLAVAAYVSMLSGKRYLKPSNLTPSRTINSVRKDAEHLTKGR